MRWDAIFRFGVERGEDVFLLCRACGLVVLQDFHEQVGDDAGAFGGRAHLGARGKGAQFGIGGDVFYGFRGGFALGFGEVEAGDLETVEEEAGAAGIDFVGGDALEDFSDGGLDGGTVFRQGQAEGGAAASALTWVSDRFSCCVVVVAEFFVAQAGAAATVAVGEDVTALEAFWCFGSGIDDGVLHMSPPLGEKCTKCSKEMTCARTSGSGLFFVRLNAKARLEPGFFSIYFYCIELRETKFHFWRGYF
jgi:hypothetical protein